MTTAYSLTIALCTNPGRVRKNNEDSIDASEPHNLLILADGMGGYKAGEVASGICVATVRDMVVGRYPMLNPKRIDRATGRCDATLLLRDALKAAHQSIQQVASENPQCEGMGTTAVTAMIYDDKLCVAYAGDSRLYRLRGGTLEQITTDHSLIEEMVARGLYSREEAVKNVNSNIVTRALGVENKVDVEMLEDDVAVGDVLLLCSDGLSDLVSHDEIGLTLQKNLDNLELAGNQLIDRANEHGGKDNISVVLAKVGEPRLQKSGWLRRMRGQ